MSSKNKFKIIFPFLLYLISRTPNAEIVCAMQACIPHSPTCLWLTARTKEKKRGSALLRGNISSITTRNKAIFRWAHYIVQAAWMQLLASECQVLYNNWSKTRSIHNPMAFKRLLTCQHGPAIQPTVPTQLLLRKYLFADTDFPFFIRSAWKQDFLCKFTELCMNFHLLLQFCFSWKAIDLHTSFKDLCDFSNHKAM